MKLLEEINELILTAHKLNNIGELSILYENLGMYELRRNNTDSGCFFLTNAYIYALEENLKSAEQIHKVLTKYGREE